MKFTCSVVINAPREKVTSLFNDEKYLKEWQDGYQGSQLLSGESGKEGAKSKIIFLQGKRSMELLETIEVVDMPYEKTALYEHAHMTNSMQNIFEELENGHTKYSAHIHYTEFHGLVPRLMARFFPKLFKKQAQKWLDQFKHFVEHYSEKA